MPIAAGHESNETNSMPAAKTNTFPVNFVNIGGDSEIPTNAFVRCHETFTGNDRLEIHVVFHAAY
jgi:hypothetical protein